MQVSRVLRVVSDGNNTLGYAFWCPGCDSAHEVWIKHGNRDRWAFDGNVNAPTFSPSVLCRWAHGPAHEPRVCHSFVRTGRIEYLSDCTHALAGQTVDLPEFPHAEWD